MAAGGPPATGPRLPEGAEQEPPAAAEQTVDQPWGWSQAARLITGLGAVTSHTLSEFGAPGGESRAAWIDVDCALGHGSRTRQWVVARDYQHGLPGIFTVVACEACGLRWLNPQPAPHLLPTLYPDCYAPHHRDGETAARLEQPPGSAPHGGRRRFPLALYALALYRNYPRLPGFLEGGQRRNGTTNLSVRKRRALRLLLAPWCWWLARRSKFIPFITYHGRGRLLDVGAGSGDYLARLRSFGWTVEGIELVPEVAAAAATRAGCVVHAGDPLTCALPTEAFDVVTLWHSLEHMPKPRAVLERLVEVLVPGGLIYIWLPNSAGWAARRFGPFWYHLDLPRHLYHYTPQTLSRLLRLAGFEVRRLRHDPRTTGVVASAQRLRQHGDAASQGLLLRSRRALKWWARLQALRQRGDNIVAIGRKPGA